MKERVIAATQFKAHCLQLMDEVARRGETFIVTFLVDDEQLIRPIPEVWDADA